MSCPCPSYKNKLINSSCYNTNTNTVYGNLGLQLFAIIIMQNQISKKGTKLKEAVAKSRDILNGKNM